MTTLKQASVETYIHEFRSLPHPGDFGIPKGHWWQAKSYADQLCTSTPKREWVGLTDDEVKHEWEVWRASLPRYAGFAKGIEAKLKEKNT